MGAFARIAMIRGISSEEQLEVRELLTAHPGSSSSA
jgi:hypothetical protein